MQNSKPHKSTQYELAVRGHHPIPEPNSSFSKHKGSTGNSLNISVGNWKNKVAKTNEPSKQGAKQSSISPEEREPKVQKTE